LKKYIKSNIKSTPIKGVTSSLKAKPKEMVKAEQRTIAQQP